MAKNKSTTPRKDLQDFQKRKSFLLDKNRSVAVAKRHKKGLRTARENIEDLCDQDTFVEFGSMIVAAQRGRKSEKDLIEQTPADGLITGIASINGKWFNKDECKCIVLSYDYTVLAGTQGAFNHKKTDRMMQIAKKAKKPIIFFSDGA